MKLNKDKWEVAELNKIVQVVNGSTPKDIETANNAGEFPFLRVSDMNLEGNEIYINKWNISLSQTDVNRFKVKLYPKNTIIFPKRGASIHTNKKRILQKDCGIDLNTMGFVAGDKIDFYYLFTWFQTIDLKTISDGSYIPQINSRNIEGIQIPLPPLSEQKQIAALFQSIETAMEQVDGQEKNLKALQKSLVNGLMSKEPEFGNLLNSKNCQPTTFGEIAECDKKYPEHDKEVERFVGLEWIEADNFQLQGFGLVANGTTFTKRFVKGDVLFGKRRAYLKKVAVADFDGICSGDILVIRAKAKKMLQGLLPYYISAEAFIQHAVSTSAGSLSPRTKWKDLAELEVSIPDLKTQSTILEVLKQLDNTVNQLKQQKATLKNLKQKLLNEILG
jgi:restriction endonuclease S subunit